MRICAYRVHRLCDAIASGSLLGPFLLALLELDCGIIQGWDEVTFQHILVIFEVDQPLRQLAPWSQIEKSPILEIQLQLVQFTARIFLPHIHDTLRSMLTEFRPPLQNSHLAQLAHVVRVSIPTATTFTITVNGVDILESQQRSYPAMIAPIGSIASTDQLKWQEEKQIWACALQAIFRHLPAQCLAHRKEILVESREFLAYISGPEQGDREKVHSSHEYENPLFVLLSLCTNSQLPRGHLQCIVDLKWGLSKDDDWLTYASDLEPQVNALIIRRTLLNVTQRS